MDANGPLFVGFGMSEGEERSMSLDQIKITMIKECGGDPRDQGWDLYLAFRRWVDVDRLCRWIVERI